MVSKRHWKYKIRSQTLLINAKIIKIKNSGNSSVTDKKRKIIYKILVKNDNNNKNNKNC